MFVITIPRARAASKSMLSVPTAKFATTLSCGPAASNIASPTGSIGVATIPSAPATSPSRNSNSRASSARVASGSRWVATTRVRPASGTRRPAGTRSTRATPSGSHQFHDPISVMIDGTSSARITVASKMIPAASPIPNCLMSTLGPVESTKNANISTSAALVTSFPVRASPIAIASFVSCTWSYASRIRVSMKTS